MGHRNWNNFRQTRKTVAPQPATLEIYNTEAETLIKEMRAVVSPNQTSGRTKFPGFEVMPFVKAHITDSARNIENGCYDQGIQMLMGARKLFMSSQRGYVVKTLVPRMERALSEFLPGMDEDLLSRAKKSVQTLNSHIITDFFDLDNASRLVWEALDVLNSVQDEQKRRTVNRQVAAKRKAQEDLEKQREQALRQQQERDNERSRELQRQRASVAARVLDLVSTF